MKKLFAAAVVALSLLCLVPTARAADKSAPKAGTPQTHHCYIDGKLQEGKTHKQCSAAGGAWKKDVDNAAKTEPAAKPEPAPDKTDDKPADTKTQP